MFLLVDKFVVYTIWSQKMIDANELFPKEIETLRTKDEQQRAEIATLKDDRQRLQDQLSALLASSASSASSALPPPLAPQQQQQQQAAPIITSDTSSNSSGGGTVAAEGAAVVSKGKLVTCDGTLIGDFISGQKLDFEAMLYAGGCFYRCTINSVNDNGKTVEVSGHTEADGTWSGTITPTVFTTVQVQKIRECYNVTEGITKNEFKERMDFLSNIHGDTAILMLRKVIVGEEWMMCIVPAGARPKVDKTSTATAQPTKKQRTEAA